VERGGKRGKRRGAPSKLSPFPLANVPPPFVSLPSLPSSHGFSFNFQVSTKKVMLQYIMQHIWRGGSVERCDALRRVLFADPFRVRSPADFESRPPSAHKARGACVGLGVYIVG
jgi:hypothetical protein